MVWWLFGSKKEVAKLKREIKKSFTSVKEDFSKVGDWITHFHDRHDGHEKGFDELKERLENVELEMKELREFSDFFIKELPVKIGEKNKELREIADEEAEVSKQPRTAVQTPESGTGVQTDSGGEQTDVQTGVQTIQTEILRNLTVMERVVLWVILNSELKLSCEDIGALVGKDKSTVRGQLNAIKQKSEGLINEVSEKNGKKRFFIDEKVKERLLGAVKMGVKVGKKGKSESSRYIG